MRGFYHCIVQTHEDEHRDKARQAAGHRADALLLVQLADFLVHLHFVVCILLLDLHHLALHGAHFEHSLLTMVRNRQDDDFDQKCKQDDRQTIGFNRTIDQVEQHTQRTDDQDAKNTPMFKMILQNSDRRKKRHRSGGKVYGTGS